MVRVRETGRKAEKKKRGRPGRQQILKPKAPIRIAKKLPASTPTSEMAPSGGWTLDMLIFINSVGSTHMISKVRYSPECAKSYIDKKFVELAGYDMYDNEPGRPNTAHTPWGFKEEGPVTDIIVLLGPWKACHLMYIEVVTLDLGAPLVIGRDDMRLIEAWLGHPIPHDGSTCVLAPPYVHATSSSALYNLHGGYAVPWMGEDRPLFGQSWDENQRAAQTYASGIGFGSQPDTLEYHGLFAQPNTFRLDHAAVTTGREPAPFYPWTRSTGWGDGRLGSSGHQGSLREPITFSFDEAAIFSFDEGAITTEHESAG